MGFREEIQKRPKMVIGIVSAIIVGLVAYNGYTFLSNAEGPQTQAYFSDDDGKTWFVDDMNRVVPFDHNGKQAVLVKLFTCDGGKTKFVGYLARYTPDIQKRLLASQAQAATASGKSATFTTASQEVVTTGTEIKRPGETAWIGNKDIRLKRKIMDVACPAGGLLDSAVP